MLQCHSCIYNQTHLQRAVLTRLQAYTPHSNHSQTQHTSLSSIQVNTYLTCMSLACRGAIRPQIPSTFLGQVTKGFSPGLIHGHRHKIFYGGSSLHVMRMQKNPDSMQPLTKLFRQTSSNQDLRLWRCNSQPVSLPWNKGSVFFLKYSRPDLLQGLSNRSLLEHLTNVTVSNFAAV